MIGGRDSDSGLRVERGRSSEPLALCQRSGKHKLEPLLKKESRGNGGYSKGVGGKVQKDVITITGE
jgi:hypothetical protein